MADFGAALPVRNSPQTGEELKVRVVDGTTPSQQLAVSTNGRAGVVLHDGTTDAQTQAVDAQGAARVAVKDDNGHEQTMDTHGSTQASLFNDDGTVRKGAQAVAASLSVTQATSDKWNVVIIDTPPASGTQVHHTSTALAANSAIQLEFVPGAFPFYVTQMDSTASGKSKVEVWQATASLASAAAVRAAGGAVQYRTGFGTASVPDVKFVFNPEITVTTGNSLYVLMTNTDNQAQDVYAAVGGNN